MEITPIATATTNSSEKTTTATTDNTAATQSNTIPTAQEDSVKAAQEVEPDEGANVNEEDSGQDTPENPNTLDVTA